MPWRSSHTMNSISLPATESNKKINWKTKPVHVHTHRLKLTPPTLNAECRHIRRHASRDEIRRRKWHSKQIHLLRELSWARLCNRFACVSSENCIDANISLIFCSFRRLSRRLHIDDMRSDVQNYFACELCAKMVKSLWNPYKIHGKTWANKCVCATMSTCYTIYSVSESTNVSAEK